MSKLPEQVAEFLSKKRIAVAGVSRKPQQPANAIYKKLQDTGHEVYAINPNTEQANGIHCYPKLAATPDTPEAVMIATHPHAVVDIVHECAELRIKHVWMHRSFGQGSVSDKAEQECRRLNINCIVGGCPMMFCEPVDFGHKCMRWILRLNKRLPYKNAEILI